MTLADAVSVASLLRASFAHNLRPYIPYCQVGVANFLSDQLNDGNDHSHSPIEHVAVDDTGRVVAHAEVRIVSPELTVLTYLTVNEMHRGHGIAGQLVRSLLDRLPRTNVLNVDVFQTNTPARRFYSRMGGVICSTTAWWVSKDATARYSETSRATLLATQASRTSLLRYGFCQAEVAAGSENLRYDLPSPSVVRLANGASARALDGLPALKGLTGIERVLCIAPESPDRVLAGTWEHVLSSHRLRIPTAELLAPRSDA